MYVKDIEGYEQERYRLKYVFKSSLCLLWGTSYEKPRVQARGSATTVRSLVPLPGREGGTQTRGVAVGERKVFLHTSSTVLHLSTVLQDPAPWNTQLHF